MARTLTSANSIIMLSVENLFDTPRQIQGFATEAMFSLDAIEINQTSMGIDGVLSGAFVHTPKVMNMTLQADSLSNDLFERWHNAMVQAKEVYIANGLLQIIATNRKYTLTRGFLTNYKPAPDATKSLQPRAFTLTWQSVTPATAL